MKMYMPKKMLSALLCLCLIFTSFTVVFAADESAISDDSEVIQNIVSKINVEYGNKIAKDVSLMGTGELGFRTAGSPGEKEAGDYILKAMKDLGLSNVRRDVVPVDAWSFGKGSLEITAAEGEKRTMTLSSYAGSVGTDVSGIAAEIVYVGDGSLAGYEGVDAKGKIVLAEFDMGSDYWMSQPAYQAELKGAKAIIVLYNGDTYGTTKDALNSFDAISRDTIPIMNISRDDGAYLKELISKGTVAGKLISDAKLTKNSTNSGNIIGEIPGKSKDQYIVFTGHYDGYFHAYQDDILGVGVFMSVAKAVLDSGYQPEHTLLFVASCAEEYGVANSHYDWIRGSWYQVNVNTPSWAGNTMICLNFDTQRPDMKEFIVNVTPEYNQFFEKYILTMNLPEPWVDGAVVKGTNGPWSDDYNYIAAGIPGLITGKGTTAWRQSSYHTNYDDHTVYNPVTFQFNVENYIAMMVNFDRMIMPPLNFSTLMAESNDVLDSDLIASAGLSDTALKNVANAFAKSSDAQYIEIQKANSLLARLENAALVGAIDPSSLTVFKGELDKNRRLGMEAYKVMQKDFMKLDSEDVVVYGHDVAQRNLAAVMDAKTALEEKDGEAAMEAILGAENAYTIPLFEKEVYNYWSIQAMNPKRTDLTWGTGKLIETIDLYDVYHAIAAKTEQGDDDFADEIKVMDTKVTEATASMAKTITEGTNLINKAKALTDQYTLKEVIEMGNGLLEEACENLPAGLAFDDVTVEHWGYNTIMGLELEGVVKNEGDFYPNSAATRGEVAEWLTRAFNLPVDAKLPAFSDVTSQHDKAVYVAAVCKAGLMNGMGNGQFMPDSGLTRAQVAAIASNILKLDPSTKTASSFTDVSMTSWYGKTVETMKESGIMLGVSANTFAPNKNLTKAEACTVVEKLMYTK